MMDGLIQMKIWKTTDKKYILSFSFFRLQNQKKTGIKHGWYFVCFCDDWTCMEC